MRVTADLHGFEDDAGEVTLEEGATGADLFEALGLAREGALLFRGGEPVPLDAPLEDGDEVRIVRTTSGG